MNWIEIFVCWNKQFQKSTINVDNVEKSEPKVDDDVAVLDELLNDSTVIWKLILFTNNLRLFNIRFLVEWDCN